jgi:phospholipid/cholesterol/gamma-HCH transport system permease protein
MARRRGESDIGRIIGANRREEKHLPRRTKRGTVTRVMLPLASHAISPGDGGDVLKLAGRLTLARLGDLPHILGDIGPVAQIDLSAVERIDTVGAWLVLRVAAANNAAITGASDDAQRLLAAVQRSQEIPAEPEVRLPGWARFADEVGRGALGALRELVGIIGFFGATMVSFVRMVMSRRPIRWTAVTMRVQNVGIDALAIIGLMSFLIGIVIAQQGAVQLRQFGLEIFTVNLVGRASIRELGLLMAAIMVAGRSGSAFAAQIGTMKLTEEIDAMRTIGVSPMEAIVLPRVMAVTLMMPLLGFFASMCAVLGGGVFCWVGLDITPVTYIQLLRDIIPMTDFWAMLIKAPVFGMLIGVTGCYEGMQVRNDAEEVGQRTTSAVVAAIFLVIVLDAFFAVFFSSVGWN